MNTGKSSGMIALKAGMRAVVVGLGKSGLAAVRYLHQQGLKVAVSEFRETIPDQEQVVLEQCYAELETGGHTVAFFADADLIVPSPGVPADLAVLVAARKRGIPVVGELALAAEHIQVPVIAVTGSNGKTTVTGLIGHLLQSCGKKVFVGGNIGTPILEYLLEADEAEVVVLELSSFQLEEAGDFRPDISLLLNLSPDHIDRHGSFEKYAAAKMNLFARQGKGDSAIIGLDDPFLAAALPSAVENVYGFGSQSDCRARIKGQSVYVQPGFGPDGAEELYELAETRLNSRVNVYNAAAALLAVRAFGCEEEKIQAGLADYQPPRHRMTPVGEIDGVQFINDSKATNVGAVIAALAGFGQEPEKEVVLIAGGRNKGGDFAPLLSAFKLHVKHLVLIGESASDLAAIAEEAGVGHQLAADMEEAVGMAFAAASSGDTVLLAPACASFDMFRSYEQRGEVFEGCLGELPGMPLKEYKRELLNAITNLDCLRFDRNCPWHRNLIALYGCLVEYSDSLIFLIENKKNISIPIVFRSLLESFVEFKNLAEDKMYANCMEANYRKEWLRMLKQVRNGRNEYLAGFIDNPELTQSQIKEHESKLANLKTEGFQPINQFEKFKRAGMEKEYRSIYNKLCSHSHNNIRSFIANFFAINPEKEDFQVSIFREFDLSEYEHYIFSGKLYLRNGSYNIHSLLETGRSSVFKIK